MLMDFGCEARGPSAREIARQRLLSHNDTEGDEVQSNSGSLK